MRGKGGGVAFEHEQEAQAGHGHEPQRGLWTRYLCTKAGEKEGDDSQDLRKG